MFACVVAMFVSEFAADLVKERLILAQKELGVWKSVSCISLVPASRPGNLWRQGTHPSFGPSSTLMCVSPTGPAASRFNQLRTRDSLESEQKILAPNGAIAGVEFSVPAHSRPPDCPSSVHSGWPAKCRTPVVSFSSKSRNTLCALRQHPDYPVSCSWLGDVWLGVYFHMGVGRGGSKGKSTRTAPAGRGYWST